MADDERYIDADEHGPEGTTSYEQEILRHMRRCIDVLSKEVTGGVIKTRVLKTGKQENYIEDVKHLIINHVDTLRILLKPFLKDDDIKKIKKIKKQIKNFKDIIDNKLKFVPGIGNIKFKDLTFISVDEPQYKKFYEYKAEKHRKIFELLVYAYHKSKKEIEAFSEE